MRLIHMSRKLSDVCFQLFFTVLLRAAALRVAGNENDSGLSQHRAVGWMRVLIRDCPHILPAQKLNIEVTHLQA